METNLAPTQREIFLAEMECTVPWHKLRALIKVAYTRSARRIHPLLLDRLLRIYFLQRWYRLTDAAIREAICDSKAMRSFICASPALEAVPACDEIAKFRRLLEETGLARLVIHAVERHLRSIGIAVAPGAIVDAALVITSNAHAQAPYARVIDTAGVCAG